MSHSGSPGPAPVRSAGEVSLDQVQRLIISALIVVVIGGPAVALAFYGAHQAGSDYGTGIGLWVISGWIGLMAAVGVLITNRRRFYSPWVALGLVPMAIGAYLIFVR